MVEKMKINIETLLALGAVCCLLYMRHYELVFHYKMMNRILDILYGSVAVPLLHIPSKQHNRPEGTACHSALNCTLLRLLLSHVSPIALKAVRLGCHPA